jgi:AcrR family transcriptional regulator
MPGVKGQVQARGVERRRAIIDAAIEHFAREGYRGTGIAAIAEQAGVTTGGLLHHFGSKERLLVEVLKRRDQEAVDAFEDMGKESVAADFALWADVASWNEQRASLTALYTVLQAESIDPGHPAHRYFVQRGRVVRELLRATLRTGVARGQLRDDIDTEAKAAEIHAFLDGASLVWLPTGEPGGLRRLVEGYLAGQLALMAAGP